MAMLPQADIDFSKGIIFQDQPSLTWIADPVTHRLRGKGDNYQAICQMSTADEVQFNEGYSGWQIPYITHERNRSAELL